METDCLFCKIGRHEIPAQIVYEDDEVVAFNDINAAAPVHILIIPKEHIPGVSSVTFENQPVIGHIFEVIRKLGERHPVLQDGFRVVVNQGEQAGQSVFHIHFHLLGGRAMDWPPG